MLATDIFKQVIGQQNFEMGAVVGFVLLIPAVVAYAANRITERRQVALVSARAVPLEPRKEPHRDGLLFAFCAMVGGLILGILVMSAWASLVTRWPYNLALTFNNYKFGDFDTNGWGAYWNSLVLAAWTVVIGTFIVFIGPEAARRRIRVGAQPALDPLRLAGSARLSRPSRHRRDALRSIFYGRIADFFPPAALPAPTIAASRGGATMFTVNPFAQLSAPVSPGVMQAYVVVMIVLVAAGTLFDVVHKRSARYFFENWRKSKGKGAKPVGGGELVSIALKTGVVDVLTSGEFCNPKRRVAHLLGMYGFVLYVVATVILIFGYPTPATPAPGILPLLWWIGGLMVCVGGYWFWFFIRVDVVSEGNSPFRVVRADLFILSLLASATLGLVWAFLQARGSAGAAVFFFGLYILATTVLFAGVPWSKFAHMFFKPAAAFEKRVSKANGTADNLPTLTRDDPEQQQRHSMELLKDAPMNMGLGINREAPRHY